MKEVEENRAADSQEQLAFCFESSEMRGQPGQDRPRQIESLAVMPLTANKVVAFPSQRQSSVEATLISRILPRTRFFR